MSGKPSFFAELKRRNVYKVAVAYAVVGWLIVQVATQVFPFFEIPNWAVRLVVLAIIIGFPIALVIAWAFETTPEGIKRTTDVDALLATDVGVTAQPRTKSRAWIYVAVIGAVLSIGLFLLGRYTGRDVTSAPRQNAGAARTEAAKTAIPQKSIAILPFENRSEDKANAYFADGIQDEILTRLAKIDDLKVISRTSTQRYKSLPENLPEIARQLRVAHVLEGSVQKAGEQVRVNVQLIKAETDAHLWGEVYDRKVADIFAVQSEIAETIAKALQVKLSNREKQAVAAKLTENPDAYDAYLHGLAIWNSLDISPGALERMVSHYSRAVQLDPKFAVAWAQLAVVQTLSYAEFDPTAQRVAEAKQALDTAMQLQPDLGDGFFALGLYRYRALRDYEGALKAFAEAIERGVNKAMSLEFSGYVKRRQGKWSESLALHEESAALDPRNPVIFSEQAETYRGLRRFAEARTAIDRGLEINPHNPLLLAQKAKVYQGEGDFDAAAKLIEQIRLDPEQEPQLIDLHYTQWICTRRFPEAIRALERLRSTAEASAKKLTASYYARLGAAKRWGGDAEGGARDLARARAEFEALRDKSEKGGGFLDNIIVVAALLGDAAPVDQYAPKLQERTETDAFYGPRFEEAIAAARAQLGQNDAAIAILRRLLTKPGEGCITTALLRADPIWDPLRSDPRFQELADAKP
jgi:TolB-like protein/Tfp pilus assembly protein PilF